jgi:hypothetical protein
MTTQRRPNRLFGRSRNTDKRKWGFTTVSSRFRQVSISDWCTKKADIPWNKALSELIADLFDETRDALQGDSILPFVSMSQSLT